MTSDIPEDGPAAPDPGKADAPPPADALAPGVSATPPRELGVMLVSAGIIGVILPGPGVPALVAGGLILWPEAFGKADRWMSRRFPDVRRKGMGYLNRFLSDLERRYPGSAGGNPGEPPLPSD